MAGHAHVEQASRGRVKSGNAKSVVVKGMNTADGFEYVEFAFRGRRGFCRNNIVRVNDVPELMEQYRQTDCYATCLLFNHQLTDHVKQNGGSVAGYRGPVAASILPFDIDSEDLDKALRTTRDLCRFLLDSWGVPESGAIPYYSGKKGFHLTVPAAVFGGVEPSEDVPAVLQAVRRRIVTEAHPKYAETIDGIGDRLRLFRLPGSRHTGTGRYKAELTLGELFDSAAEDICRMASEPRANTLTDPTGLIPMYDVGTVAAAADAYQECAGSAREYARDDLPEVGAFLERGEPDAFLCPAERELFERGVPKGARSWTALRFAARGRAGRYGEDEATAMIASWNQRNDPPMSSPEASRIVSVAYRAASPYQFGCGTGAGDAPATRLVFEACPYTDRRQCEFYGAFQKQRMDRSGAEQ